MCGFAGFLGPPDRRDRLAEHAKRMADAIWRRGPDSSGQWIDSERGVALAHRRLAIVDLSPAGHQPMVSASGRLVLAFNGEIYNHLDVRRALERAGTAQNWRGTSDTETLLAAIEAWGVAKALEGCVGMFAFAVWDRDAQTLTLARDRLGEKPLYYGRNGRLFFFGSDLAAFRAHPEFAPAIDRDAVALLLRYGRIPAPRSIYRDVFKLAPGAILTVEAASFATSEARYWNAEDAAQTGLASPFAGSADDAVDELERLLAQSLAGQKVADVPIGAFLSGGVDSPTVVASLQAQSPSPVKTFTIGYEDKAYDESEAAGAIARRLGTGHAALRVTERDALDVVPRLPDIYSEPFADASQIPTFLVSQFARQSVTVSISGDGGDELFSGYRRHDVAARFWRRAERAPVFARRAAARAIKGVSPATWDRAFDIPMQMAPPKLRQRRIGEALHKGADVLEAATLGDAYDRLSSHWSDASRLVRGASNDVTRDPRSSLIGADPVKAMMLADLTGYLPDGVLTKLDRASMAVSLESRVPLLDHRVVEFALSLPSAILRRDGKGKWPLRALLARRVPRELFERPKSGFAAPIDSWLRGPLRDWAEDLLDEKRLVREGYFDPMPIRAAWADHRAGRGANAYKLWTVLMFQSWLAHTTATGGA